MARQRTIHSNSENTSSSDTIICLGQTFSSDEERRAHFTELLREKLSEPAFRAIEGFPIAKDEDILALSDPPYYTACPNPWIAEFVAEWENEKPHPDNPEPYHREPFAADVSEGKNDPIYNAHSYHTKVPHKAIMRYILHYTEPGDIVFDGFCGTGMTGVAAQMCGDRAVVESLGYRVENDGTILNKEISEDTEKEVWVPFSKLGARRAVLNDLSPAATFIAYNYNTQVDVKEFEREANRILAEVDEECGWMYTTLHEPSPEIIKKFADAAKTGSVDELKNLISGTDEDQKTLSGTTDIGRINYTVWSDVFVCPECAEEIIFWKEAVDKEAGKVMDEFPCPHCGALLTKRKMERARVTKFDGAIGETIRQAKQVPVLINYTVGKKRHEKVPDAFDCALIAMIEGREIPYWYPTDHLPEGYNTAQPMRSHGITHVHHFYTKRNLGILSKLFNVIDFSEYSFLKFLFSSMANRATKMNRIHINNYFYGGGGCNAGYLKGTLYISSIPIETSVIEQIGDRINWFKRAIKKMSFFNKMPLISTNSSNQSLTPNDSIDYIFTDPPFGGNLMYL